MVDRATGIGELRLLFSLGCCRASRGKEPRQPIALVIFLSSRAGVIAGSVIECGAPAPRCCTAPHSLGHYVSLPRLPTIAASGGARLLFHNLGVGFHRPTTLRMDTFLRAVPSGIYVGKFSSHQNDLGGVINPDE
jgi:hypothetical protein